MRVCALFDSENGGSLTNCDFTFLSEGPAAYVDPAPIILMQGKKEKKSKEFDYPKLPDATRSTRICSLRFRSANSPLTRRCLLFAQIPPRRRSLLELRWQSSSPSCWRRDLPMTFTKSTTPLRSRSPLRSSLLFSAPASKRFSAPHTMRYSNLWSFM